MGFQSTLLVRGATYRVKFANLADLFQSTLLVRGATGFTAKSTIPVYISIHAPRERSDLNIYIDHVKFVISIHAPRERSDFKWENLPDSCSISIHAPRERSDPADQSPVP